MAITFFKWFFLLNSLLPIPADRAVHPLYVSITELNHNAVDRTLEVSCKIFTDDFEKALFDAYHKKTDLTTPKDKAEADKLVADYIRKHLVIRVDGKPVTLDFVGFERERDAVWSYFEVKSIATIPKKINARNSILYETYEAQINLMHVTVQGNRKSTKLNNPEAEANFEF